MADFYATYPPAGVGSSSVQTVQGEGTAGTPVGGLLTVQGDPSGTPIPISGNITASSASVSPTGAPVPGSADYVGMNVGGNLTGLTGTSSGLNVVVNAAIPAGTAIIGKVGIDQTTPGTTNGVQVNAALPVGANIIGKFGIDQTTPGTTNAVALTAGSAIIGNVRIDQTTPGTTNGVQVNAALPAGSNSIGNIGTVATVTSVTTVAAVTTVGAVTAITNALPAGTNLMGKVGVDQTTPGTTNGVQVVSGTTAAWQAEGAVAFGSITNSFATIFTPTAATKIIFMRNNTNAAVSVSMDAGSTTNFTFDAGDQIAIDFIGNGLLAATSAIQIKYAVGAPTSGSFRVNGVH